jgi:hypothetical protein
LLQPTAAKNLNEKVSNKMKLPGIKAISAIALSAGLVLTATACTENKGHARDQAQAAAKREGESLEITNLKKKRDREENPDTTRYLYEFAFGSNVPVGYYVTVGKISSNSSQIGPELELANNGYRDSSVLDSAKDDGSYGDGDPGIFFFTADGTMVETTLDYIQSDQPLALNVPQLYK